MQVSLGYDPKGKMVPVDVISSKEGWSEYTLDDGSILRAKAVVLDVKRADGQYSADGSPIYVMQFAFVNQVKAPDKLKKQG
jgi:S-adenosylhomocysteine hydrolase